MITLDQQKKDSIRRVAEKIIKRKYGKDVKIKEVVK